MATKKSAGGASPKSAKKTAQTATAAKAAKTAEKGRSAGQKYTDPDLRERIKAEVTAGDKGGKPGQWSARKAQMVAHEYEAEGGGYRGGRDETQASLKDWGDEHWTTKDGKPAQQGDGMHRYLPESAWDKLSPAQEAAADKKKLRGDHEGKQFVENTSAAKRARKQVAK